MMTGGKLASWLRVLLPSGGLGGSNAFLYALTDFEFLKIGPLSVWTPWLLLVVPVVEIPLFLWLTVRRYCKRGQKGRQSLKVEYIIKAVESFIENIWSISRKTSTFRFICVFALAACLVSDSLHIFGVSKLRITYFYKFSKGISWIMIC